MPSDPDPLLRMSMALAEVTPRLFAWRAAGEPTIHAGRSPRRDADRRIVAKAYDVARVPPEHRCGTCGDAAEVGEVPDA